MSEYGKLPYRELEDYSNMQAAQIRKKNNKIEQLQARVKELEAINLGLTKTLLEEESEKARLVEALEPFAACADELDGYPADGVEPSDDNEWASFRLLVSDYRRARTALAAHRKQGGK